MIFPVADRSAAESGHGGSLAQARARFPGAREPWIDLSTGINPHHYPLFEPPANAYTRLPEPADVANLCAIAARAYGAPGPAHIVAAPGTQILLPRVAALARPGRARVLAPTYAEHARALALAGHMVEEAADIDGLMDTDIAVVVNPNNPDGRVISRSDLLALAASLGKRGGLLVVDEAFMDVGPLNEAVDSDTADLPIVALRSFGKFFGLAGVRLGFAIAPLSITARLAAELGPWAVSGVALSHGARALADSAWQDSTRARLSLEAAALDALLARHGLNAAGGTHLYRFLRAPEAAAVFDALGRRGIWTRAFAGRPHDLRIGLPANAEEFARLGEALSSWRQG